MLLRITATATTLLDAERATVFVVDLDRREVWSRSRSEPPEAGAPQAAQMVAKAPKLPARWRSPNSAVRNREYVIPENRKRIAVRFRQVAFDLSG